jgi:hypothetical protein
MEFEQKQQILPASRMRVFEARSPPIHDHSRRKLGESHQQGDIEVDACRSRQTAPN